MSRHKESGTESRHRVSSQTVGTFRRTSPHPSSWGQACACAQRHRARSGVAYAFGATPLFDSSAHRRARSASNKRRLGSLCVAIRTHPQRRTGIGRSGASREWAQTLRLLCRCTRIACTTSNMRRCVESAHLDVRVHVPASGGQARACAWRHRTCSGVAYTITIGRGTSRRYQHKGESVDLSLQMSWNRESGT